VGSYHITSKVAGGELIFSNQDKEHFLELLERFAAGFFVQIHAFAIMGNHFHILATCLENEAQIASKDELIKRYHLMYGDNLDHPPGSYDNNYQLTPDEDGGIERLRRRLGSISRFMQELKQTFAHWYNTKYDRTGYLWGGRFKGILVSKGVAQLIISSYIDLNPVRANIVSKPEDYRWCSLGMRVRSSKRAKKLLHPITILPDNDYHQEFQGLSFAPIVLNKTTFDQFSTYREFVYRSGGVTQSGKAHISHELVKDVIKYHGKMGIEDRLQYRLKNLSEGLAFGSFSMIAQLQKRLERKFVRPRSFMKSGIIGDWSFTTRVLRN
jgi:REP element-mobilizing transposase RayT